jgi:hypothetical protein
MQPCPEEAISPAFITTHIKAAVYAIGRREFPFFSWGGSSIGLSSGLQNRRLGFRVPPALLIV